ncbi:hypothetical protein SO802_026349 [Lithocarpus litseifolius]|uniref:Uncharacterized protein n=1 Tax=Lithocarpus litseifolius TaxID=425828 RepID=A0AAW2C2N2_9ROSI
MVSSGLKGKLYEEKLLGKVTSAPPSSVVIEEIIESPADLGSSDSGKGQAPSTIEGFTSVVLALHAVVGPASSSVQEGTAIAPAIQGFDPFILPKPALGIFGVSGSKALKAILQRKKIGKGTVEPVRNRVITEEAVRNLEYNAIQQLNKLPAQISILVLLLSSNVH